MYTQLGWLIKNRITYVVFNNECTLDDLTAVAAIHLEMLHDCSNRVHHIADFRLVQQFPTDIKEIRDSTPHLMDPKLDYVLMLYENVMLPYLGTLATQLAGSNFKGFRQPGSLFRFLRELEPDLAIPTYAYQKF